MLETPAPAGRGLAAWDALAFAAPASVSSLLAPGLVLRAVVIVGVFGAPCDES
jgi:hypothetical protein